ncbi:YcxB family protein [Bacillus velezensis]|uniref:YcxB family protein n=1 Tax=Bacillus velezensis TaxID=492670 RepID=UPI0035BF4960
MGRQSSPEFPCSCDSLFGSHGDRNGNLILPSLQNIQNESAAEICQIHQLGISQKQKNASILFEWDELLSAREHKDIFRLQTSGYGTLLLPKRLFYSQKDIAVFRQMLRENVNGKVNVTE